MLAAIARYRRAPANRHSRFLVDPAQIEFKPPPFTTLGCQLLKS
jgi:hypothetical protein